MYLHLQRTLPNMEERSHPTSAHPHDKQKTSSPSSNIVMKKEREFLPSSVLRRRTMADLSLKLGGRLGVHDELPMSAHRSPTSSKKRRRKNHRRGRKDVTKSHGQEESSDDEEEQAIDAGVILRSSLFRGGGGGGGGGGALPAEKKMTGWKKLQAARRRQLKIKRVSPGGRGYFP